MAQTKAEKSASTTRKVATGKVQPNVIVRYYRQTRGELRRVTWPTREESQRLTLIVLGVTAAMAIFLGLLDFLFSNGIQGLVELVAGI